MNFKALALLLSLCLGQTSPSFAQATTPNKSDWQTMREAIFDSSNFPSTASPEDRAIAQRIWANELMARLKDGQRFLPGFALIGDVREGDKRIVFSMFAAAASEHCEPPANGASARDIFVECRMRVTGWPPTGRQIAELPGYCMMYGGEHPKNRVEYRYDTAVQTVHFRTIQYGKVVPACNRALKLG